MAMATQYQNNYNKWPGFLTEEPVEKKARMTTSVFQNLTPKRMHVLEPLSTSSTALNSSDSDSRDSCSLDATVPRVTVTGGMGLQHQPTDFRPHNRPLHTIDSFIETSSTPMQSETMTKLDMWNRTGSLVPVPNGGGAFTTMFNQAMAARTAGVPTPVPVSTPVVSKPSEADGGSIRTRKTRTVSVVIPREIGNLPIFGPPTLADDPDQLINTQRAYKTWAEFEGALELWKETYFHPMRVASSEQMKDANGVVNEGFRYRYVVYHCAHYGEPRMRGAGKRPNQTYLPRGCKAMLRINYSFPERCLRVTTLIPHHTGHECNQESYGRVAHKTRRSIHDRFLSLQSYQTLRSPLQCLPQTNNMTSAMSSQVTTRSNTPSEESQIEQKPLIQMQMQQQLFQQQMAFFSEQQRQLQESAMIQQQNMQQRLLSNYATNMALYNSQSVSVPVHTPRAVPAPSTLETTRNVVTEVPAAKEEAPIDVVEIAPPQNVIRPTAIRPPVIPVTVNDNSNKENVPKSEEEKVSSVESTLLSAGRLLKADDFEMARRRLGQLRALVEHWKKD